MGKELELNERRAVVVGICEARAPYVTFPIIYAKYSDAMKYANRTRKQLSFVLVRADPGQDLQYLKRRITEGRDFATLTWHEFMWQTIGNYLKRTGIPVNFGITIILGFIVGAAVSGQTFYIFVLDNLKQFGALKAIGVGNGTILMMILLQAGVVAAIGYAFGIGLCAAFFEITSRVGLVHLRGFTLPWEVVVGTAGIVLIIAAIASVASIRRVMVLDPRSYSAAEGETWGSSHADRRLRSYGRRLRRLRIAPGRDLHPKSSRISPAAVARCASYSGSRIHFGAGEMTFSSDRREAGKRSLIPRIIAAILAPTEGSVEVLGQTLTRMRSRDLVAFRRANIGFIFQQYNRLPALTAAENAARGAAVVAGINSSRAEKAALVLDRLGIRARMPEASPATLWRAAAARRHRACLDRRAEADRLRRTDGGARCHVRHGGHGVDARRRPHFRPRRHRRHSRQPHFGFADRITRMDDGRILGIRTTASRGD